MTTREEGRLQNQSLVKARKKQAEKEKNEELHRIKNEYARLVATFRAITPELTGGVLREKARKARRMFLLFSSVGVVWCFGLTVHKVSIGWFEIDGLIPMIPYILSALIIFFGFQFGLYWATDHRRHSFLFGELERINDELDNIVREFRRLEDNATTQRKINQDIEFMRRDLNSLLEADSRQTLWDTRIPLILLVATIFLFIGRYVFGWFVETPAAPLIPHIPSWAPLWQ